MSADYRVLYFGLLAERRGLMEERVMSEAGNPAALYAELDAEHALGLEIENFRAAVNDAFVAWDHRLQSGDAIAFLPPMSGG
ncbi:MAG: MoaD/ThiS family protein [Luteolibacter sp.]